MKIVKCKRGECCYNKRERCLLDEIVINREFQCNNYTPKE